MTGPTPSRKTVLFIHRGALGDFVITFPLLTALKHAGYSCLWLCTRPGHGALAHHLGLAKGWLDAESGHGYKLLIQSDSAIKDVEGRAGKIDLVIGALIDPEGELKRWLESRFKASVYLFFPRPKEDMKIHATAYLFDRLSGLKLKEPGTLSDEWKGGEQVLIHPGSGGQKKNFEVKDYLALYNALGDGTCEFLLGPAEIEQGRGWPGNPVVPGSLVDLSNELVRAKAVISNDSGVAHLSAYLGTPTVVLFKSSDPAIWAPLGKRVKVYNMAGHSAASALPISHLLSDLNEDLDLADGTEV